MDSSSLLTDSVRRSSPNNPVSIKDHSTPSKLNTFLVILYVWLLVFVVGFPLAIAASTYVLIVPCVSGILVALFCAYAMAHPDASFGLPRGLLITIGICGVIEAIGTIVAMAILVPGKDLEKLATTSMIFLAAAGISNYSGAMLGLAVSYSRIE